MRTSCKKIDHFKIRLIQHSILGLGINNVYSTFLFSKFGKIHVQKYKINNQNFTLYRGGDEHL